MPRPVCVPCSKEMTCTHNGVFVRLCPGVYQAGDEYTCTGCGAQIVAGLAHREFESPVELPAVADLSGGV